MTMNLDNLQPGPVWRHFSTLCSIPRASNNEAALRAHLIEWAKTREIETVVDQVGNLLLKKPGSVGCESAPAVVLQGHLDMVCQANSATQHDFEHDPIRAEVEDGWVIARETTLGADNGIGVALALAALEQPGLKHPPLEVLLTVNEESGMSGARALQPGFLAGRKLINLDTEEWGHFYLGCAGGIDVEARYLCVLQDAQQSAGMWRLDVQGLQGGHSGIDINLGRGNAIRILAEALQHAEIDFDLVELAGGTARNAIPREAYALLLLPDADSAKFEAAISALQRKFRERLGAADPNLTLACAKCAGQPQAAVARQDRDRLLQFIVSAKNGVQRMSEPFPGVVDTSGNLGVVSLVNGEFAATFKVRSLSDQRAEQLADALVSQAAALGLNARKHGAYPGWTPNPDSPLLWQCRRVYSEQFGAPASIQVIHAGLECGLFAASHPDLDMISFGPDIKGAHAPGERVEIESVARCWRLLKAVLGELAGN